MRAARPASASPGGAGGGGDSGGGKGWLLLVLIAVPVGLFALSRRRRRRRQEEAQFEQARGVARDDVISLGEEIRALDLDMEMPDADAEAKRHYGIAVEHYQLAEQALEGARRPEDLRGVSERLEEGRFEMEVARAGMEGRAVPERRPPCFFDPRHGPSVEDVEWAPPGGEPRSVPACAADAVRVKDGEDPAVRQVAVNGREVPYWQAGPAYGPFAGGFFAGGLVPGLFLGSMLDGDGGLFGGDEVAAPDAGDFGDFGGRRLRGRRATSAGAATSRRCGFAGARRATRGTRAGGVSTFLRIPLETSTSPPARSSSLPFSSAGAPTSSAGNPPSPRASRAVAPAAARGRSRAPRGAPPAALARRAS